VRRCALLLFELRESRAFDFGSLVAGGDGLALQQELYALAPHCPEPVKVEAEEVALLAATSATRWSAYDDAAARFGAGQVDALLAKALLIGDDDATAAMREHGARDGFWWPPAAAAHHASRWQGVVAPEGARSEGPRPLSELYRSLGPPPPAAIERADASRRVPLPRATPTAFDVLLDRRSTCRNFDTSRPLPLAPFAQLMERVFGARATATVPPDVTVIKRTSPSGGGLHPTEAYVLIQQVEGLSPGLYHYHPIAHALEPQRSLSQAEAAELALRLVAGQEYFADAPVLVALASRFPRSLWKYRQHAKAYRAAVLDVGHLSQTLYLCATEQGMAAYVTAAINEVDIEHAFGLEPLEQGPLAVCGFGWRAATMRTMEFDPLRRTWPGDVPS
jgi:putative peptide maturation dehydrogenase